MALVTDTIINLTSAANRSPSRSPASIFSTLHTGRARTASSASSNFEPPVVPGPGGVAYRMSHTSSKTWISDKMRETDRWHATTQHLQRRYQKHAQVPWTFNEWVQYRQATIQAEVQHTARRIAMEKEKATRPPQPLILPLGGKAFIDGRACVLATPTMWCPSFYLHVNYRFGGLIWPSEEEMAFEGDDRAKTNYGRYLPIVRDWKAGNDTVNFKIKHDLPFFDFDRVCVPPTMEDVYLPVDEIEEEDISALLNQDILAALDDDDIL